MPQPFTYEHFIQAFRSPKDNMLLYYIDEAVAVYCRLRGKSVGPRPASPKDYSPEYADAFEAANWAVYEVARKMHGYEPAKGAFKPYLDRALRNTLITILKEDEPDKYVRLDLEGTGGAEGGARVNEPDDEEEEREKRIRQHQEEALEAVKKFIDGLPQMQRAAIYASSFGAGLVPAGEKHERDYAEALAEQYNTTALYIRQLVNRGMKKVVAEARRQGFSEESMTGISMGYLQAGPARTDVYDTVLKSVDELDAFHQFLLLRHLAASVK